jgi:hypothetical protein
LRKLRPTLGCDAKEEEDIQRTKRKDTNNSK